MTAAPAEAQVVLEDLVFTGGASVEGYQGNLPAAAVTAIDSTEFAAAAVGEFGVRGRVGFLANESQRLRFSFDGGLRQFAAGGFELQDYAPREWVGAADLNYERRVSDFGFVTLRGNVRGREVHDRPPMPLFLQPGYWGGRAGVGVETRPLRGTVLDLEAGGEWAKYGAPSFAQRLLLLNRDLRSLELGVTRSLDDDSSLRGYTILDRVHYPRQRTFDERDPFRRDRTYRGGLLWTRPAEVYGQVGIEGAVNRSNSRRPEYDALSIRAVLSAPLWRDVDLTLFGLLTAKRYVQPTEFARLIPGEEADNASIAYAALSRPLAANLDATMRLGWTRAETDLGEHYYQRVGLTLLLNYRPNR